MHPSKEEIISKFLEHNVIHLNQAKLYTHGSKLSSGSGCAVIYEDTSYVSKLPDYSSVFTVELTAVATSFGPSFQKQ